MVLAAVPGPKTRARDGRRLSPSTSWVAFSARAKASRASGHVVAEDLVVGPAERLHEEPLGREGALVGAGEPVGACDVDGEEVAAAGPGRDACRSADEGLALGATGEGDDDPLAGLPGPGDVVLLAVLLESVVDPVGGPQQRQLAQRVEVAGTEVVRQGGVDLLGCVDVAVGQAPPQRLGGHVLQLDLVGRADDGVGDGLPLRDAGDLLDHVVDRLQVLDVDGGDDVDAGGQQLLDVLPALGVAGPGDVGVGELVDQRHLRPAGQHRVDVHLGERRFRGRRCVRRGTTSRPSIISAVCLRPWVSTNPTTTSVPRSARRCPSPSMA